MTGPQKYLRGLLKVIDDYIEDCNSSIEKMRSVKSDIRTNHEACNAFQLGGTSITAVGSGCLAAGLVFPPAAVFGAAYLLVGSATNLTTSVVRDTRNRCE